MDVYDVMNGVRPLLERLLKSGVDLRNLRNIGIYEDYRMMTTQGEKAAYIFAALSEKHGISEASIKRIIKRFSKKI